MIDSKEFWESKILNWESGRYNSETGGSKSNLLEWFADRSSASLRFRIKKSGEILKNVVQEKHVVDLGCGSGLLAPVLLDEAGAASYVGIDISQNAIDAASKLHHEFIQEGRASFHCGSVSDLAPQSADIVFSLGLLDWLTDDEMKSIFAWAPEAQHFHAIAERRMMITRYIHKAYCYVAYGYRTQGYVPRYYAPSEILRLMEVLTHGDRYIYRNSQLSFGAFVSTFDFDGASKL